MGSKKSLISLLGALLITMCCLPGFANEPTTPLGFAEIEWGTDIKSLDNMVLIDEAESPFLFKARLIPPDSYTTYIRSDDARKFFSVEVNAICYLFFDDKFCSYGIERKSESSSYELLHEIEKIYGEGVKFGPRYINRRGPELFARWDFPAFSIWYYRYRLGRELATFHPIRQDIAVPLQ